MIIFKMNDIECPGHLQTLPWTYSRKRAVKIMESEWIKCPVCGSKTRDRIREDTVLKNYPLYCPKCKQETLIDVEQLKITVIKEPDAKTQSR